MSQPYEIVLSMRRGTATWITDLLIDNRDAQAIYGEESIKLLARGLVISDTRARLKLPFDQSQLKTVRNMFWHLLGTAPYGVAVSLERLVRNIDEILQTSIVDHLVKYMKKVK